MRKKIASTLLALAGFLPVNAQYTFTISVNWSGNCSGYTAQMNQAIRGFQSQAINGFPTRELCEQTRATCHQELGHIELVYYDVKTGKVVKRESTNCKLNVVTTPCSGRPMAGSVGTLNALGVSQGTSFYSPNTASEIQNWAEDEAMRRMGLDKNGQPINETEISMGSVEADKVREEMRKNASLIPPLDAFRDDAVVPYTDEISMAQSRVLDLTGMDITEIHENIASTESSLTADYNQRMLELNKQLIINEIQMEYAFISALCNKNMPESERKRYESKLHEMELVLMDKFNVSREDIEAIKKDANSPVSEVAKLLDDDRQIPEGYDLNKITEFIAGLTDYVYLKYYENMQKQIQDEKNAITFNYNNDMNMLRAVDDLLKIKKGVDSDGKLSYGTITPERANDVMSWFGSHGKETSSLFPERFIEMHMKKDTKIEIK